MKTRIDLNVVLPDVSDEKDACIERVKSLVDPEKGIEQVHVVKSDSGALQFCLHYESSTISLTRVVEIVKTAGATVSSQYGHAVLGLRSFDSEDAAGRIEASVVAVEGVLAANVNLAAQLIRVEWDKRITNKESIRKFLVDAHYSVDDSRRNTSHGCCAHAHPDHDHHHGHSSNSWFVRNKELFRSLLAGFVLGLAWILETTTSITHSLAVVLYLFSYVFGAYDLLSHLGKSAFKGKFTFDIDLLMLLAAIGSAILGEWEEGALLLFLFSLAHSLEHYALGRARGAIRSLADLAPSTARVLKGNGELEVRADGVNVGDIVIVKPGERIAVDGIVRLGFSSVNQAPITGESLPVDKREGAFVFAGSVNGEGVLEIVTSKAPGDRTLDRVIKLVEEAQTQKAPTQLFTDSFERIFVPTVLVADLLLIVVPPMLGVSTLSISFYKAMAMLVAASPCALALGTPSAVLAGIAQAARKGVLIKGGSHLEQLGALRAIAFDKTGTLTLGKPEVTDVIGFAGADQDEVLTIAGAVEKRSQHPLAQAIVRRAERDGREILAASDVESITGKGVRGVIDSQPASVGSLKLWENETVPPYVMETVENLESKGRSVVIVRLESRWVGALGLADQPRDGIKTILSRLRNLGISRFVMLTGDNKSVGEAVAREVGIDEVQANLLPDEKVKAIRALTEANTNVAMVGDGVNDAPALAHATVGIAMGGAGTAVALETADVVLMSDDLSRLPLAVELSRKARSIIRQNMYFAMAVIGILIASAVTGLLGIAPTVALHEGSTLLVIANSLRLLTFKGKSGVEKTNHSHNFPAPIRG